MEMGSDPEIAREGQLAELAAGFSPLSVLRQSYLRDLLNTSRTLALLAGEPLFERGGQEPYHYYLVRGRLCLQHASGYTEHVEGPHQFPIANELPRPCRAEAKTDCVLLLVDSDRLDRNLSWSQVCEFLLNLLASSEEHKREMSWLTRVLSSNLFLKVPPINAEQILPKLRAQQVKAGDVMVRQDQKGDCCFFIKHGSAQVLREEADGSHTHLANIGVGRCFGEDALVYDTLRNATVVMTSDGELMRLNKADFALLRGEPRVDELAEQDLPTLDGSPVFLDVRTPEEFAAGHLLTAANWPLSRLHEHLPSLRPLVPYVIYCDTGRRSRAAAYLLCKRGFHALALRGGLVGAGMQYQLVQDDGGHSGDDRPVYSAANATGH